MLQDALVFGGIIIGLIVSIVCVAFGISALYALTLGPAACTTYGEAMGLETSYTFYNGCFITTEEGTTMKRDTYESILNKDYRLNIIQK